MEKEKKGTKKLQGMKKALCVFVTLLVLFLIWFLCAKFVSSPLILPEPKDVFFSSIFLFSKKTFWNAILATFLRVVVAFFISSILGILLGALCSFSKVFNSVVEILLSIMRSLPFVSIILLSLFWLGSTAVPVLCAVLMALPVVVTASTQGFSSFSVEDAAFSRTVKLSSKAQLFFIRLPKAFPYLSQSLKSANGMIWKVVVSGEVLSIPRTAIGSLLQDSRVALETSGVFAITIVVIILGYISSLLLIAQEKFTVSVYRKLIDAYFSSPAFLGKHSGERSGISSMEITNLGIRRPHELYSSLSLKFEAGNIYAISGTSGAGKSTLMDYISGNLMEDCVFSGKLTACTYATGGSKPALNPKEIRFSYLFQTPYLLPSLTVFQNILLIQRYYGGGNAIDAMELLKSFNLETKVTSLPTKLSGGQKQRAGLAMALAANADVYLFDEGLKSQDKETYEKCLESMKSYLSRKVKNQSFGSFAIIVTHSPEEGKKLDAKMIEIDNE